MILFDIILAILYIIGVLLAIVVVIAFAVPAAILYGIYYVIFVKLLRLSKGPKRTKSYENIGQKFSNRGKKQSEKFQGKNVKGSEIKDFVMKAIEAKKSGHADSEEFQQEVHDFVQKVNPSPTEEDDKH